MNEKVRKELMDILNIKLNEERINFAAEVCFSVFGGDPPCNFNNMDERVGENGDDFCEKNCGYQDYKSCWKHAIKQGWWKNE